ncbi:hypothetical protein F1721_01485 [Saccharopolyspora hirsuta]|uniref:Alanine-rich protein n=1 Tax=Saccharopolyspora hirsuta TaxID=1837 RepID=A0A5M7CEQ0_SACHI|nr:hypothetical protein [Saccharopolyspora hirsuta]KAA5838154.1 hypothetical protein F1721_01485 [Saccharopolyspora hirsuta]
MRVTGYSYPWDVDAEFLDRATDLGVDEVAVAVAYHSARAATPWSKRGTSVLARHAALYRPVRTGWGVLRPAAADWVDSPDSAGDAVRLLSAAGVPTAAWLVLTHNSLLGSAFPEFTVRNCFGEHYPWALCPAHEEVREFAVRLTAEALADLDVRTVVLEACGQLGVVHQHQHEKTDAVWSPAAARLLSVCCCPACSAGWAEEGIDPVATSELLRAEVRRLISDDLTAEDDRLPVDLRAVLLGNRQRATDRLRREVCEQIGPQRRVLLHASADPWATGALPGLTPSAAGEVDGVVLPCWKPTGIAEIAHAPSAVDIGAYVTAVGPEVPDTAQYVRDLRAAGADELHLYHLGLAGPARWPHLRRAVEEAHR